VFDGYPMNICQMSIPKGGVSKARNAGLDASKADWVMFCDFDDQFSSIFGLHLIFCAMEENKYDTLWSCFTEETMDNEGHIRLVPHERDWVFIHGKAHRRQYLVDNNLRFHDKLTIHEDVFFTMLTQTLAEPERIGSIRTPFYLWKWNSNSVVRKDNVEDYILFTYDHLIRQRIAITEELIKRGKAEETIGTVVKTVIDAYYDCQQSTWRLPKNAELLKKAEDWFAAYLKRYANYYVEAKLPQIAALAKVARDNTLKKGTFFMEAQTLKEWLDHIMKDAKPIPMDKQNV
jgi:glycosyltransferase involved in cell wall biosynthesis